MRGIAAALIALSLGACSLDRAGIGGGGLDASIDAQLALDGRVPLDAPGEDAEGRDAEPPVDAPIDAGIDASPCVPSTEICDLVDQDCDMRVDEDACGCRSFEFGGHVYQDCPHVSGFEAWGGACRRIGPGYDLVVIETAAEDDAIDAAIGEFSWIGLNDFEANGSYVWRDRSTPGYLGPWLGSEGTRENEACFAMHAGGEWDDLHCATPLRVICEGDPSARCVARAADDASCDGVDDDCDGGLDEDCDLGAGCTSFTFWDRVHLACTSTRTFENARLTCRDAGWDLATIESATHDDAIVMRIGEAWIGLRQGDEPPAPDAGWRWVDGSMAGYRGWGGGEPNDSNGSENGMEDCARIRTIDDWADLACATPLPFLCSRPFAR